MSIISWVFFCSHAVLVYFTNIITSSHSVIDSHSFLKSFTSTCISLIVYSFSIYISFNNEFSCKKTSFSIILLISFIKADQLTPKYLFMCIIDIVSTTKKN